MTGLRVRIDEVVVDGTMAPFDPVRLAELIGARLEARPDLLGPAGDIRLDGLSVELTVLPASVDVLAEAIATSVFRALGGVS